MCFINSFYRFVMEPELMLGANNSPSHGPVAKFLDVPESHLFTLNMITPEGWLVETVHSNCDLDNINLEDVSHCGKGEDRSLAVKAVVSEQSHVDINSLAVTRSRYDLYI